MMHGTTQLVDASGNAAQVEPGQYTFSVDGCECLGGGRGRLKRARQHHVSTLPPPAAATRAPCAGVWKGHVGKDGLLKYTTRCPPGTWAP